MGDLGEVEVEDVVPVVLGRRAEPDVAAHAARAHERGVERLDRDVGRPDEVDLLGARLGGGQPQRRPSRAGAGPGRGRRGGC